MIHTLENGTLQLQIIPHLGRWRLAGRQRNSPYLEDARLAVIYRRGRTRYHSLDRWRDAHLVGPEVVPSPHGPMQQIRVMLDRKREGLAYEITFALPSGYPLLFWKVSVANRGDTPVFLERIELLSAGFIYRDHPGPQGSVHLFPLTEPDPGRGAKPPLPALPGELAFYSHGWQSWSYCGVYGDYELPKRLHSARHRKPIITNPGTPLPNREGLFSGDMFGVLGDRSHRTAILAGFLSQEAHFGSLEAWIATTKPALRLWANGDGARLDPGLQVSTDWACLQLLHLDTPDPLGPYIEAVARQHGLVQMKTTSGPPVDPQANIPPAGDPSAHATTPVGWCSWYNFFKAITPRDIRQNVQAAAHLRDALPLDLIQIDDGYQAQVGDWFDFGGAFPEGLEPLAAEIRAAGFAPGLWLAPFLVHPASRLAAERPEWLLRGRFNRPVNAGFIWNTFTTALDMSHPGARDYATQVVQTAAQKWGFPYLKLDFLYAGALAGRHHDPTLSRAQVLRSALRSLRAAAGQDAVLLACGCPLGPAIGLVDAMRVGPDVDPHWRPSRPGARRLIRDDYTLPAARNAIHNTLARAPLNGRWWINDPDCLLLRPETHLSLAEVHSLATVIALAGGSLILSDHLPDLPAGRLSIAQALLPLVGRRPHLLDWFDAATPRRLQVDLDGALGRWHLVALFNWQDRPADLTLNVSDFYLDPAIEYFARDFWNGETYRLPAVGDSAGRLLLEGVAAHGVALLALRPWRPFAPQYLGSDLHISQGMEVSAWKADSHSLSLGLDRPGRARGSIELGLPRPPTAARLDEASLPWQSLGAGRYLFPVEFDRRAQITVNLSP